MKDNIHPKWHEAKVTCSCGNSFTTGSTLENISVDICSQCHPFFTGEMRFVDVQGRVEKFQAKQKKGASYQASKKKHGKKSGQKESAQPQSLKEMLTDLKKQTLSPEQAGQKPSKS
jgi:large subunit ribosomal protein L31